MSTNMSGPSEEFGEQIARLHELADELNRGLYDLETTYYTAHPYSANQGDKVDEDG